MLIKSITSTLIRTFLGKVRAWIRLALMQKKLAEYFQVFVENKEFFRLIDINIPIDESFSNAMF